VGACCGSRWQTLRVEEVSRAKAFSSLLPPEYAVLNSTQRWHNSATQANGTRLGRALSPQGLKALAKELQAIGQPFVWNVAFDWQGYYGDRQWQEVLRKLKQATPVSFSVASLAEPIAHNVEKLLGGHLGHYASLHVRRGDVLNAKEGCETSISKVASYVRKEIGGIDRHSHQKKNHHSHKHPDDQRINSLVFFTDERDGGYLRGLETALKAAVGAKVAVYNGEKLLVTEIQQQRHRSDRKTFQRLGELLQDNYFRYSISRILRHRARRQLALERRCATLPV